MTLRTDKGQLTRPKSRSGLSLLFLFWHGEFSVSYLMHQLMVKEVQITKNLYACSFSQFWILNIDWLLVNKTEKTFGLKMTRNIWQEVQTFYIWFSIDLFFSVYRYVVCCFGDHCLNCCKLFASIKIVEKTMLDISVSILTFLFPKATDNHEDL